MSASVSDSRPAPSRRRRRRRPLRLVAGLGVLLGIAGYFAAQYDSNGGPGAPRCTVRAAAGGSGEGAAYEMSPEQASNAATIAAVGTRKGLPVRAVTIALATAMQESGLRNLRRGDRDSLGLFQQRPSQGWGTARQILDPVYSAGIFYDRLAEVRGYSRLPLTVAAQRVQMSGFPQAYAKHEPDAQLLAGALTGREPAAVTCRGPVAQVAGSAVRVRAALVRDFGPGVLPGGAKGSSVPASPLAVPAGSERRGWAVAHWAVSQAAALDLVEVAYAGRVWTAGKDGGSWRPAEAPSTEVLLTPSAG
ncbi:hypothetical protein [Streptomyces sp. NRRL S-87]|uniref:hypothetical protein n=1 Tax=Streptomyces sp. NRRL S-87 TaxID=1463920 RepID=UPI000AC2D6D0|nr:hypothetical protein [Streptomyces sp. NRRL S-87]